MKHLTSITLFIALVLASCDSGKDTFDGNSYFYLVADNGDTLKFLFPGFSEIKDQYGDETVVNSFALECTDSVFFFSPMSCDTAFSSVLIRWDKIGGTGKFEAHGSFAYGSSLLDNFSILDSAFVVVTHNSDAYLEGHVDNGRFIYPDSNLVFHTLFYADIHFRVGKHAEFGLD